MSVGLFLADPVHMNSRYANPDGNGPEQEPNEPVRDRGQAEDQDDEPKGHDGLKGTDTPATTDVETIEREKGKRTTM